MTKALSDTTRKVGKAATGAAGKAGRTATGAAGRAEQGERMRVASIVTLAIGGAAVLGTVVATSLEARAARRARR